ncbi:cbb3-type cytochrome c oxidase subunit III [Pseudoduganella flava]|uniref:C-type cytochrome n=1 Tax=Pseudoduganella flava TaxID=871742 RepID=A0A562PWJ9_9BURK|nr:cytochrome c [Pseudoduganella flava]QGZ39569.1 c-type cytochrome [Pseudoduganella flava]TWI48466.1 cbb3-type cytochrome c oxidase subunit III [Pseudoduganella flava]
MKTFLIPLILALACGSTAAADVPQLSKGFRFAQQDGKALYAASCQGCHMAHGEGARGAGFYPKLADNPRVQSQDYVAYRVVRGYRGMPPFAGMMSDEQIAAVVTYVRSNLGHVDGPPMPAEDVRKLRE